MKKAFLFVGILFLSFSSVSLLKPQTVLAAEGGPAGKIMLRAVPGPKAGQVTLSWGDADSADNYHLVYGTDPKNMKYGVMNLGRGDVYTVGMLNPGTKYYFAIVPVANNVALYTSEWVSAWPMGGVAVKPVTPVTTVTPVTPATPMVKPTIPIQPQTMAPATTAPATGPVGRHWLVARPGPNAGEVTLTWRNIDDANNYHLVYGTEPGKYKYGAVNIGWINWFTVRNLVPGRAYYFALVPVKNDVALYTTNAVTGWAKANVQVVQTTREAIMQPQPQPMVKGVEDTTVPLPDYPSGQ